MLETPKAFDTMRNSSKDITMDNQQGVTTLRDCHGTSHVDEGTVQSL